MTKAGRRVALAAFVLVAAVVLAVVLSGAASGLASREGIEQALAAAGPFGPLGFILLCVLLFPFFLLGPPVWASLSLWPVGLAILYSSLGCIAASSLFYGVARMFGKEWAQARIPARIRQYEDRLVERPLRTMLLMRLLLWANPAVDLLIGVSRVRPREYLLATAVGLVPSTAGQVLVIGTGLELALDLPQSVWWFCGAGLLTMLVAWWLKRRRAGAAAGIGASAD